MPAFDFAAQFDHGLPYQEFLTRFGSAEHQRRWASVYQSISLSDTQKQLLASFKRQMKVLCVAGAWCGDCVNQCPIFQRFSEATSAIDLRFYDRDDASELAHAVRICGGARVPVLVFLAEDGEQLGWYGDRTLAKYRQMAHDQLGPACPTGLAPEPRSLIEAVTQEWLDEFERMQLLLRLSSRLRQKHGD